MWNLEKKKMKQTFVFVGTKKIAGCWKQRWKERKKKPGDHDICRDICRLVEETSAG